MDLQGGGLARGSGSTLAQELLVLGSYPVSYQPLEPLQLALKLLKPLLAGLHGHVGRECSPVTHEPGCAGRFPRGTPRSAILPASQYRAPQSFAGPHPRKRSFWAPLGLKSLRRSRVGHAGPAWDTPDKASQEEVMAFSDNQSVDRGV